MAHCAREALHGVEDAGGAMVTLNANERDRFWAAIEGQRRSTPPVAIEKRKAAQWITPLLRAKVRHLGGEEKVRHATMMELLQPLNPCRRFSSL